MAKFVKYLPDFNWHPTVVTVDGIWVVDAESPTLLAEVSGARVLRLPMSVLPPRVFRALRAPLDRVLVPDSFVTWLPLVQRCLKRLLSREKFHVALTSSRPFSLTLLGPLFRRHNIPWVTDFRDPWTENALFERLVPLSWLRPLHMRLERRAARDCSFHIANTDGQWQGAQRTYPILAGKSAAIPNGFDGADFAEDMRPEKPGGRPWRLVYTGSVYHAYNPEGVFACIRNFLERVPSANVEIHYAGSHSARFMRAAEARGLRAIVHDHGHVDHRLAVRLVRTADLLLLYLPGMENARTWVPMKLYEYLAAGRPIFAVVPPGDASAIIERSSAGDTVTDPHAAERGGCVLANRYHAFLRGDLGRGAERESAAIFERRALTARLAGIMDRLVSPGRSHPLSTEDEQCDIVRS
jgi:hypothetical protein